MPPAPSPLLAPADVDELADALFAAFEAGRGIAPPSETHPGLTLDDAYAVQRGLLARHAAAGRTVAGRKIGLTSLAMQAQLGIDSPDFGVVLDAHTFASGATLSRGEHRMLLPKLEPELAFVLDRELKGPGVSVDDVLAATRAVVPVLEVIDSRVEEWRIGLVDTVADNASCFGAVLGTPVPLAAAGVLPGVHVRFSRDGEVLTEGDGAAVMGHPAAAVAWLADELGRRGEALPAGQPILAGSFTAAVDALPGTYVADFGPALGTVSVEVVA